MAVLSSLHCVKSVQILIFFFGPYFPVLGLYTEIYKSPYSVQLRENKDQKKLRIRTFFAQGITIF